MDIYEPSHVHSDIISSNLVANFNQVIMRLLILLFLIQINLVGQESANVNKISIGETFDIQSSILKESREIYIYQPQGLWGMDENMDNLPVIYVLDAESQFNHTAATVDFLSIATNGNDFMPRCIVVGISNVDFNTRSRDLTPMEDQIFEVSGGGLNFLNFITEELIPYIDSNYPTSGHRTIIGHSLGGLITFEALLRKRDYFANYIAIDPAFGIANESYLNEVIDTLNQSDLSTENVFFAIANNIPSILNSEDIMSDTSDYIRFNTIPNQKFRNSLESNDWNVNLNIKYYPKENHFSVPHKSTHDGLRELYSFYTFPEITNFYHPKYKHKNDLVDKIKDHYNLISNKMGYEAIPMQGYINSFAYGLSQFDREDMAISLLEYNIELHPKDPIVYNNLGYFFMSKEYNQKAINMYNKSLELRSDDWVANTIKELKHKVTEQNKER